MLWKFAGSAKSTRKSDKAVRGKFRKLKNTTVSDKESNFCDFSASRPGKWNSESDETEDLISDDNTDSTSDNSDNAGGDDTDTIGGDATDNSDSGTADDDAVDNGDSGGSVDNTGDSDNTGDVNESGSTPSYTPGSIDTDQCVINGEAISKFLSDLCKF